MATTAFKEAVIKVLRDNADEFAEVRGTHADFNKQIPIRGDFHGTLIELNNEGRFSRANINGLNFDVELKDSI